MNHLEQEISSSLHMLGIKPNLRGHECIKVAVRILQAKPSLILNIGKFYAAIGNVVKASPGRVATNIRNAWENAQSDFNAQKRVLGTAREMCSVEFVATLSEAIRIRVADREVKECSTLLQVNS